MKRLPTCVEGLDEILEGGLFEGGVYILEGPPGVGKTTLANQIAYTQARSNACTLYVTMLAESHSRMLQHMEQQEFFERRAVNARVFYVSGYREFEQSGLKGVVALLRGELVRSGASLLVIDGLVVDQAASSNGPVREFVHELQSLVSAIPCTCLVLTSGHGNALSAEQTMVDGILCFEDHTFHWRAERRLQVRKFRGSQVIRGKHTFCISSKGLQIFPRLESLPLTGSARKLGREAVPVGLPALDAVLHDGGLFAGSATVLIGHGGSGKTTLALAFAAASSLEIPGLMFTGTEHAEDLERLGSDLGFGVQEALHAGALTICDLGRQDESMDEMGHKMLRMVDEQNVRRLVVDGMSSLADTLAFPERGYRFLGRLLSELKQRGVTSLFTVDPGALAVAAGTSLADGVIGWFDNAFAFEPRDSASSSDARSLKLYKARGSSFAQTVVDVHIDRKSAA